MFWIITQNWAKLGDASRVVEMVICVFIRQNIYSTQGLYISAVTACISE